MSKEEENKYIYQELTKFSEKVLKDDDPQNAQISYKLEKLKPKMAALAMEFSTTVEDIFMRYMDAASEASVKTGQKFDSTIGKGKSDGNPVYFDQF